MSRLVNVFLVVVSTFASATVYGQTPEHKLDSLQRLISSLKDTSLVDVYNQLSWNYRNIEADSAYYFGSLGLKLAQEIGYTKGQTEGLNFMGIAKRNQGDFSEAMELFVDALRLSESTHDLTQTNYTLINIGNIYLFQMNYHGALQYFEKSLKNAKTMSDNRMIAYSHVNLGRAYIGLNELNQAQHHITKSLQIREDLQDLEGITIARVELADIFLEQGYTDRAHELLIDNMEDVKKLGDNNTLAYSHISLARICLMNNDIDNARNHVNNSLRISKEHQLRNIEVQALQVQASIFEKIGQYKEALTLYKKHISKKDSIFNEENIEKIAEAFSKYSLEKSEIEKSHLKEQFEEDEAIIKRQKTTIALSIVSTALFFIIAVVSIRSASIRKRLNLQIQEQKEEAFRQNNELIDLNNEKNNLIRILSHDLRAPINNIKGLTQVHQMDHAADFTESENETLNMIKSESDRLLNMITKILNVEALNDDKHEVKFEKVEVNELAANVVKSFSNAAETKGIEIKSKHTDEPIHILGDEVHLRQIIENLVSNAIKFTPQDRAIEIALSAGMNKVKLAFSDQGPGLTTEDRAKIFKKFQTLSAKPTGNEDSTGLGLSIVKRYTEEMNGKVWYESQLGRGTTFFVEFDKAEANS